MPKKTRKWWIEVELWDKGDEFGFQKKLLIVERFKRLLYQFGRGKFKNLKIRRIK